MERKYMVLSTTRTEEDLHKIQLIKQNEECSYLSNTVINILYNRGLDTSDKITKHLFSTLDDVPSAELLKDGWEFVVIVTNAIQNKEEMTIYGDYDVDGVTSVSIAVLALRNLGIKVNYYTNNRFIEGYGITPGGVKDLMKKFPDTGLIITTDNGIVAYEGVQTAKDMGVKVIVTDHHDANEKLPNADAIINPKRKDCTYSFKGLCGAGVIYKLLYLLYIALDADIEYMEGLLDILALGTVCDMVSLTEENRIYVKEGLKLHRKETRPAFKILREVMEIDKIDEETFGFQYGPTINALGRIYGSVDEAIELLTTTDTNRMLIISKKLVEINNKRKEITELQKQLARGKVETIIARKGGVPDVIVLRDDEFSEGVVGLVASDIKEIYNRPTFILASHTKTKNIDGTEVEYKVWKGSGRSIEGFSLKENLDKCSDVLEGYGGHEMAAGLSVSTEKFDIFVEKINEIAKPVLTKDIKIKKIKVDTVITNQDLNMGLIDEIDSLRPFGQGFSKPNFGFAIKNVEPQIIGKEKNHLKLNSNIINVLGFGMAERYHVMGRPKDVKVIGVPQINVYNGKVGLQILASHIEKASVSLSTGVIND